MNSLKGSMSHLMSQFHERMSKFEAQLTSVSATSPGCSLENLAADFATFKSFIVETLGCLQLQMEALSKNLDALEMRGRRKILLLHGVTEQSKEDTAQVVAEVLKNKVKIEAISVAAIRRCHRMGNHTNSSKPRPILVKFEDVELRDKVWYAKTKFKGSGITLSEFLTRSRHEVFMAAREKFGITNCWTKQGQIHVLGPDGAKHVVVTHSELNTIGESEAVPDKQASDQPTRALAAIRKKRAAATKK